MWTLPRHFDRCGSVIRSPWSLDGFVMRFGCAAIRCDVMRGDAMRRAAWEMRRCIFRNFFSKIRGRPACGCLDMYVCNIIRMYIERTVRSGSIIHTYNTMHPSKRRETNYIYARAMKNVLCNNCNPLALCLSRRSCGTGAPAGPASVIYLSLAKVYNVLASRASIRLSRLSDHISST